MNTDLTARSRLLRQNMTLETLYRLTVSCKGAPFALYRENGRDVEVTREEAGRRAMACAYELKRRFSAAPDGFIALSCENSPLWFAYFWGILAAGKKVLLIDAMMDDMAVERLVKEAGAVGLVAAKPRLSSVPVVLTDELHDLPDAPQSFSPAFGTAVALCTSGTTGDSRVFVYDERAVCEQVLNSERLNRANPRIVDTTPRRALAFLPFHHVFGLMVNHLWVNFIGYASVFPENRSPEELLSCCRHFKVNLLVAVPLLANNLSLGVSKKVAKLSPARQKTFAFLKKLSLLVQSAAPEFGIALAQKALFRSVHKKLLGTDIRCVILGGSHTPEEHIKMLSALGFYTVCGFGMTETAVTSVETSKKLKSRLSGSVGRPLDGMEYRVLGGGKTGEMQVRGATLHTGRMKDGSLLPPDTDKDGWFSTGDVVRLEEGMQMFVEGRCKDVIINASGENVYPDELEDVFSRLDGVEQMCILGTALPGQAAGKMAYEDITLVLNVGSRFNDEKEMAALAGRVSKVNAALPVMRKVTRAVATAAVFECANRIKVKRAALKKQVEENLIPLKELNLSSAAAPVNIEVPAPAQGDEKALYDRVRRIYAETLEIEENGIADDAHFINDLGGDSLQVMSLSIKVEEAFGVLIPVEEYGECTSVRDLAKVISRHQTGEQKPRDASVVTPVTRFEDSREFKEFYARQQALLGSGMENPYFVCHESALFDTSLMDGKEVLNFGSYNYVGMSGREETKEAAKRAIDKYGTSASGSRLLAGEKKLYQELESAIAEWKHAESALVLVGGHSTNVTIVGNFCGERDLILYDQLAHNSVQQGCRLSRALCRPFPHNDTAALESILKAQRSKYEKVLIIIEGAYSMDGDIAPVPEFVRIKKQYGCFLMVDEAHSACVIGETGGGVDEYFHLDGKDIDIKMGTLSKGLGTCGGYLAGSQSLIDYLRYNLPGFVFSVGISPPLAAACMEAIRLIREDKSIMQRMRRNIELFTKEARLRGFDTCLAGETAIIPIMVGRDEDAFLLSNMLREKGVFVPPAVFPAVPRGKARLRFCVISEHKPEQIIRALDALKEAANEAGVALPPPAGVKKSA